MAKYQKAHHYNGLVLRFDSDPSLHGRVRKAPLASNPSAVDVFGTLPLDSSSEIIGTGGPSIETTTLLAPHRRNLPVGP